MKLLEKLSPFVVILAAVGLRLIPHLPNFTPIGAMALFGGVHLNRGYAILVPIAVLFLSDLFIGFYSPLVMVSVYGSFILTGLVGIWLRSRKTAKNVVLAAIFSSILFFLITNFAVWLGGWYPRSFAGLIECYTLALPFFRNTLFGNLFYTGLLFGGYEVLLRYVKKPRVVPSTN
jgi:hypothetical protein